MRRNLTILIAVLSIASIFAQSPEKMSYQAAVRDSDNQLVTNSRIGMQISILQGTDATSATTVYVERQFPTTNENGLALIEIGGSDVIVISGTFSEIDWSTGTYFLKSETDPNGDTDYTITGTSQLLSVPYALYAKNAGNVPSIVGLATQTSLKDTASTIRSDIPDVSGFISSETDPVFILSPAAGITKSDTVNLKNLSGINTGDQDLSNLSTNSALRDTANTIRKDLFSGKYNDLVDFPNIVDTIVAVLDTTTQFDKKGHYVGELFEGGIVFWVTPDGQSGLIASLEDVGVNRKWSATTTTLVGESARTFDNGAGNTAAIVAQNNTANFAATLCDSYAGGGYSDWYLPATSELDLLISQEFLINFVLKNDGDPLTNGLELRYDTPHYGRYWSSTEFGSSRAYYFRYLHESGSQNYIEKSISCNVRAVRSF